MHSGSRSFSFFRTASSPGMRRWLVSILAATCLTAAADEEAVLVPFGGNGYVTKVAPGSQDGPGRGGMRWSDPGTVLSLYFRVDQPAELDVSLRAKAPGAGSKIAASVEGKTFHIELKPNGPAEIPLGRVHAKKAGYLRVDLRGEGRAERGFGEIEGLLVKPLTAGVKLNHVKDNEGNRFYWGRRGPSVHLGYTLPENRTIEWFHSEITVPEGSDPIGSYFMANGFGEGYFGFQVNGPDERRVLFSVWSPFHTDNPKDIPEDQRIVLLAKGEGVRTGEFGNEGSGGQSFLIFPWKAGKTYRFLNRAHPDGEGNTIYTGWFRAPDEGKWRLIASFKRPKTDKHLTGIHSFLENFSDRNGWLGRQAFYGNQWVRDTEGKWHRLTQARFTGDDIANRGYRLDFAGGIRDHRFFLRNGGYFAESVPLNSRFTREPGRDREPDIALEKLEGY